MGVPEHPDPAQLRISDDDRHQVAEVLRQAAGEGRLDLEELDERLGCAYEAKVYGDLVPLLADLPSAQQLPVPPASSSPAARATGRPVHVNRYDTSLAIMGGQDRVGVWEIGATHTAFSLMGGIKLDLRQALFAADEVVIYANAVMGGIDVVVNASTRVSLEGVGIMGGYTQARDRVEAQLDSSSPLVRLKGFALMGGVTVVRKPMPGESRKPAWRRR